jgi:hypothetical protein
MKLYLPPVLYKYLTQFSEIIDSNSKKIDQPAEVQQIQNMNYVASDMAPRITGRSE